MVKDPTAQHIFNMDKIMQLGDDLNNLRALLIGEVKDGHEGYSGALGICNTGLLLLYENGTKVPTADEDIFDHAERKVVVLWYVAEDIFITLLTDKTGIERYLELLNEDTTPRILKAMDQEYGSISTILN
ncbi:hypothetical protein PISL3812_08845 [Talaromyces islandicus]|uniref:Uncharacterized protein n=1 Tax=Talaromyces islandicus TaxID=28573 RepID=A0A0U1M851_TALIS|nr:hypothetical protein PISL3812_08845 [Talaromyces islandicus]